MCVENYMNISAIIFYSVSHYKAQENNLNCISQLIPTHRTTEAEVRLFSYTEAILNYT